MLLFKNWVSKLNNLLSVHKPFSPKKSGDDMPHPELLQNHLLGEGTLEGPQTSIWKIEVDFKSSKDAEKELLKLLQILNSMQKETPDASKKLSAKFAEWFGPAFFRRMGRSVFSELWVEKSLYKNQRVVFWSRKIWCLSGSPWQQERPGTETKIDLKEGFALIES